MMTYIAEKAPPQFCHENTKTDIFSKILSSCAICRVAFFFSTIEFIIFSYFHLNTFYKIVHTYRVPHSLILCRCNDAIAIDWSL